MLNFFSFLKNKQIYKIIIKNCPNIFTQHNLFTYYMNVLIFIETTMSNFINFIRYNIHFITNIFIYYTFFFKMRNVAEYPSLFVLENKNSLIQVSNRLKRRKKLNLNFPIILLKKLLNLYNLKYNKQITIENFFLDFNSNIHLNFFVETENKNEDIIINN